MKTYKLITGCLLSVLLMMAVSHAETSGSLPILKMAPDARAAALGETGVSSASGAMAAFHNPALLPFAAKSEAAFGYSDWLLDMSIQTVATNFRYNRFSAGFSFVTFNVPDLERRVLPTDEPIETFSAHDFVGGASLAYKIKDNLSLGLSGRWIYQQIYIEESNGYEIDFGSVIKFKPRDLTIGVAVRNMGKMNALQSEETPLPTYATIGISGLVLQNGDFGLHGMGDAQFIFEEDLHLHLGIEVNWKQSLFFRLGYQTQSELKNLSGGLGINWNRFGFDYAYQTIAEDFNATHRFGFQINF